MVCRIPSVERVVMLIVVSACTVACADAPAFARDTGSSPVVALLEDDVNGLLVHLQGQSGGEGSVEMRDIFSGRASAKIIPMQRFGQVPGWSHPIVEHPGPGEYRYVRFAWKGDGCVGTMVQFNVETGWSVRYCAGLDVPGWGTQFVAPAAPDKWVVVTRDLFADFGKCTITGIALTAFEGRAAYFDHIYLGRSVEDLDRVDATGLREGPQPQPSEEQLERMWMDLGGDDAPAAYRAFWSLVASPAQSVPFIRRTLTPPASPEALAQVRGWITDLNDEDYARREEASRQLAIHSEAVGGLLKQALSDAPLEARIRIERILAAAGPNPAESFRAAQAARVLHHLGTPEAKAALDELPKPGAEVSSAPIRPHAAAELRE